MYDNSNIFKQIIKGEKEASFVYCGDKCVAFMDLYPMSLGHTLVIPKEKSTNIFDLNEVVFVAFALVTRSIASSVVQAVNADGVEIFQLNGPSAGQTVFHTHFHIVPKWKGKACISHDSTVEADRKTLDKIAKKIRREISVENLHSIESRYS